ncbi:MAG: thioredoxin TrxA [Gammaproteobacteria bacterium]|nr:thioredoxin TrxA [Gammaproteobacteria bacterium]NND54947.1 thioredoxin TrxA [Gammaproteobacteria bacterium]
MSLVHTSDDSFDADVIKSETPVLVDFWAEWCGPCKAIAPVLDELAGEYDGKVTIVKLDVDANPQSARQFNVRSIPTLILFKDGDIANQHVGATSKQQLKSFLDSNL